MIGVVGGTPAAGPPDYPPTTRPPGLLPLPPVGPPKYVSTTRYPGQGQGLSPPYPLRPWYSSTTPAPWSSSSRPWPYPWRSSARPDPNPYPGRPTPPIDLNQHPHIPYPYPNSANTPRGRRAIRQSELNETQGAAITTSDECPSNVPVHTIHLNNI